MRIAISYDYDLPVNAEREGVGIFAKNLFYHMMKIDKNLYLEFWYFKFNEYNVKNLFNNIIQEFPDRVFFYNEILSLSEKINFFYDICKNYIKNFLFESPSNKKITSKCKNNISRLIQKIKYSKADVVYSFFITLTLGKYFNKPCLVQVHDLFSIEFEKLFSETIPNIYEINKIILKNLKEFAKNDSHFICTTNYIAQNHILKYINFLNKKNVHIVSVPPMIDIYQHDDVSKDNIFLKFGIKNKYIFYPSHNRPNKNFIILLKSLYLLKKKGIEIQFVTTGYINDVKSCREYTDKTNINSMIIETGSISDKDLYTLYKFSSMVVVPTLIEGYGMSSQALEALLIGGIPVIHSKSYGMKESLNSFGLNFATADLNWFDTNDEYELTDIIISVIKNPLPSIKKQSHIIKYYLKNDWNQAAKQYLDIFYQLK